MNDVASRITVYLFTGGLFNPEMADHVTVRDLLIDSRAEIERLQRLLHVTQENARMLMYVAQE